MRCQIPCLFLQGSEALMGPRTAVQHMLPLLRLLDEQNLLPALAFQFDRAGCMALTGG